MHVLVAPGAFAGALTASAAAEAFARGWRSRVPDDVVDLAPMSDGDAGLLAAVGARHGGDTVPVTVAGPLREPIPAAVLVVPGRGGGLTAFVEGGSAVGVHLVPEPDAARVAREGTSVGVGELVRAALDLGARRVVLGMGDAAPHDGGRGFLRGLASLAADHDAVPLAAARDALGDVELVVAVAAPEPLLGLHGAGAALALRPGIDAELAQELERTAADVAAELERAARDVLPRRLPLAGGGAPPRPARVPGSGAGGGVAFAAALLGARVVPGSRIVAGEVDLAARAGAADVVVTGAADLDAAQTSEGGYGVVAAVARAAAAHGVPVLALGGRVGVGRREVAPIGVSALYEVRGDGGAAALEERAARLAGTWSW